ncbi:MAG TPA: 3-hydroxyacyl-CoA dehydrogenase NAD-binding domain-containing protein, partial [Vicinamibacterales bacterium]|nr:3-hydroxyacyl-CoA dehydrogenase NAD-binding domain-containing protein [Vicinamibacterales bacterium]
MTTFRSVGVLGAGTMGAQIAAHFANAGVPVLLLDVTADAARDGLKRAQSLKPDPFFTAATASLISIGGFDSDLQKLSSADWIVEAIVEQLDAKRALLARVDDVRRGETIVSSNTSGIPIRSIAEGLSAEFRRHWLGTHFFNPPRYLPLVEVIPTADTDRSVVDRVSSFLDVRLGKGVVVAKDSPNFIANRIGLYGVIQVLCTLETGPFTIEEIDAMTGPALGRPKSATFRTMDIAGLDVLGHVVRNLKTQLPESEANEFALPPIVNRLIDRGSIGEKSGEGFYKRQKGPGGSEILTLDPATMTYRAKQSSRLAPLDAAKAIDNVAERTRTLFLGKDKVGEFLRSTLGPLLVYAARVALDVAHSIDDVDRAMRWGFGWELGPFEIWDAIGVREVLDATGVQEPPPLVANLIARGRNRFRDGGLPPAGPGLQILKSAKERSAVVKKNPGASLIDLGDGVLAIEFHSKMNTVGGDTLEMIHTGVREAAANFMALVVGNDAPNFSAGANLMLLLLEAQEGNFDDIDLMIRTFQGATQALRHAPVPVVACPAGLTLGGGCEIALHGDRVQAAAETYMGLVEVGVGLIPAAGGTKEMLARAVEHAPDPRADLMPFVQRVFETIGF